MLRGRVLLTVSVCWMGFMGVLAFADLAFGVHVPQGTKLTFVVVSLVFGIWILVTAKPRSTKSKLRPRR